MEASLSTRWSPTIWPQSQSSLWPQLFHLNFPRFEKSLLLIRNSRLSLLCKDTNSVSAFGLGQPLSWHDSRFRMCSLSELVSHHSIIQIDVSMNPRHVYSLGFVIIGQDYHIRAPSQYGLIPRSVRLGTTWLSHSRYRAMCLSVLTIKLKNLDPVGSKGTEFCDFGTLARKYLVACGFATKKLRNSRLREIKGLLQAEFVLTRVARGFKA